MYIHLRGAFASLLVPTFRAMRRPLLSGTSDRAGSTFLFMYTQTNLSFTNGCWSHNTEPTSVDNTTIKYIFSGHESFPCRSLWLKKGYDFIASSKNFNDNTSLIELGVGKNMVSAIRYWLRSFGISKNDKSTPLGNYLFDEEQGRDKYIEDLASLWLLHFTLVFNGEATLYKMLFCGLQRERSRFTKEQAQNYVRLKMAEAGKQNIYNENTVKKDIAVFLLNYLLPRKPQTNEDYSSLLIDLDLIRQNEDGKEFYFNAEGKRTMIKEIFMYALLSLKDKLGDNTIPYEIIQDQIGLIFCMQDQESIEMLKQLSTDYSEYMTYNDVAGIRQVQFIQEIKKESVLDDYYEAHV